MDSHGNHQTPSKATTSKRKTHFLFYSLAILILLLALSVALTRTHLHKIKRLRSILFLQSLLGFFTHKSPKPISNSPSHCILWMAPFLSGGGYSSEAWSYILSLHEQIKNPSFKLAIEQHGDLESLDFWEGLPENSKKLAMELYETNCRMNETIVVCHSEPGAWYPPLFQTLPCPPTGYDDFRSVIGRTMFETDRVNPDHVERCNRMDYVWVPTDFHVASFVQSGVDPSKVVKIVQPVDVEFFDPSSYEPLNLSSVRNLVLGPERDGLDTEKEFVFLSVFKWEYRKGWDVLLRAYLKEFSSVHNVALYLLTNPYHSDRNFGNKVVDFVKDLGLEDPAYHFPRLYVIDKHIAQTDLPKIYKAADAFVLPTRGEGWGRPLVEAMAMELPVIATNWSGPTEYLTEQNGYPLKVEKMIEVEDEPFKGHRWAEPSVDELRVLMRHVMSNADEGKAKGKQARDDMIRSFSPEIVAKIVADQIEKMLK